MGSGCRRARGGSQLAKVSPQINVLPVHYQVQTLPTPEEGKLLFKKLGNSLFVPFSLKWACTLFGSQNRNGPLGGGPLFGRGNIIFLGTGCGLFEVGFGVRLFVMLNILPF